MGKETIDGHETTHYWKKVRNLGYEDGLDVTDYWVSDNGILIKMKLTVPEVSVILETRDIKLMGHVNNLFLPPPDYKKAGHRISWKAEKQKLDAASN